MVAKPEKGKQVESVIVQMATTGQIGGKLSENDLIGLVERVNAQTQKTTTVKVCHEKFGTQFKVRCIKEFVCVSKGVYRCNGNKTSRAASE